jgi:hypothetical protein
MICGSRSLLQSDYRGIGLVQHPFSRPIRR